MDMVIMPLTYEGSGPVNWFEAKLKDITDQKEVLVTANPAGKGPLKRLPDNCGAGRGWQSKLVEFSRVCRNAVPNHTDATAAVLRAAASAPSQAGVWHRAPDSGSCAAACLEVCQVLKSGPNRPDFGHGTAFEQVVVHAKLQQCSEAVWFSPLFW